MFLSERAIETPAEGMNILDQRKNHFDQFTYAGSNCMKLPDQILEEGEREESSFIIVKKDEKDNIAINSSEYLKS
jgi:hypothetical protein